MRSGKLLWHALVFIALFLTPAAGRELDIRPAEKTPRLPSAPAGAAGPEFASVAVDFDVLTRGHEIFHLLIGGGQWRLYAAGPGNDASQPASAALQGSFGGEGVSCGFINADSAGLTEPLQFFISYQNRRGQLETQFLEWRRGGKKARIFNREPKSVYRSEAGLLLSQSQGIGWNVLDGPISAEMLDTHGAICPAAPLQLPAAVTLHHFGYVDFEGAFWVAHQTPKGALAVFRNGRLLQSVPLGPSPGPMWLTRDDDVGKVNRGVPPLFVYGTDGLKLLVVVAEPSSSSVLHLFRNPALRSRVIAFRVNESGCERLWESELLPGYVPALRRFDGNVLVPVVNAGAKRTTVFTVPL